MFGLKRDFNVENYPRCMTADLPSTWTPDSPLPTPTRLQGLDDSCIRV